MLPCRPDSLLWVLHGYKHRRFQLWCVRWGMGRNRRGHCTYWDPGTGLAQCVHAGRPYSSTPSMSAGTCSNACPSGQNCVGGACTLPPCPSGQSFRGQRCQDCFVSSLDNDDCKPSSEAAHSSNELFPLILDQHFPCRPDSLLWDMHRYKHRRFQLRCVSSKGTGGPHAGLRHLKISAIAPYTLLLW